MYDEELSILVTKTTSGKDSHQAKKVTLDEEDIRMTSESLSNKIIGEVQAEDGNANVVEKDDNLSSDDDEEFISSEDSDSDKFYDEEEERSNSISRIQETIKEYSKKPVKNDEETDLDDTAAKGGEVEENEEGVKEEGTHVALENTEIIQRAQEENGSVKGSPSLKQLN
ncbi:hypothetical protein L2E82_43429 [Cichorium intybus]|uniref:Uncharacterized protein n=1 Tax=Cichorium intybus TaxID=13427 RepID=A0ACB8ZNN6_CICIN|nr:hypothetical protein L2E82_43429 [Cichorium intybus]